MQGDSAERSEQMVAAIRLVLEREQWAAGDTPIAFQACDDSIAETGEWDEAKCRENAEAYAANPDVIGVIGTYNSGCAQVIIPILNQAPDGGVAMVSPGNTLICLTQPSTTCKPDEPGVYYPSGTRNYARVVPNDAFQSAGLATFAQQQQIRKPYVLYAPDEVTKGQGETFRNAARDLGLDVVGFEAWDPDAADYTAQMEKVRKSGADALLLAGLLEDNGAQIIKDKVAVLGPNEGDQAAVQLLAPDGFAQQETIDQAGVASAGMFVSVPGRSPEALTGAGAAFVDSLESQLEGEPVEEYAPYAGEAAEVLLKASTQSAIRADVVGALLKTKITNAIVGTLAIESSGDPDAIEGDLALEPSGDPSVGPITVSVARGTFEDAEEITPPADLAAAARGE